MSNSLDVALSLAAVGCPVFPIAANQKFPPPEGWQKLATTDPETIKAWLRPTPIEGWDDQTPNMGVLTGNGLLVLDIDNKNGKHGDESLTELQAAHGPMPPTLVVETPTGGSHQYFKVPDGLHVSNSTSKIGEGLDVRGDGGYVVAPYSKVDAGTYRIVDASPIADAPTWLVELASEKRAPKDPITGTSKAPASIEAHPLTLSDARGMQPYFSNKLGDYDPWFEFACAVRRAGLGAQDNSDPGEWDGFADDVSRDNPGYISFTHVQKKMREADGKSGYGWRHLIEIAKSFGFEPTEEQFVRWGMIADADDFDLVSTDTTTSNRFKPTIPNLEVAGPLWRIKAVLPLTGTAAISGAPGDGKSTVAGELEIAVARGEPWHGRKVKRGRVVHISCEGVIGFRLRLKAELQSKGLTIDELHGNLLEITDGPNLMKKGDVTDLIARLKAVGPVALVVVDTLARATAGAKENTDEMGIAMENCTAIQNAIGGLVLLVHHTGKDPTQGMRGWSGIAGAIDTEISIVRSIDDPDLRSAWVKKQRDGEDHIKLFDFRLERVVLGHDEDGDEISSMIVKEVAIQVQHQQPEFAVIHERPTTAVGAIVWDILTRAKTPLPKDDLVTTAAAKLIHDVASKKRDNRRFRVKQAIELMVSRGSLKIAGDSVSLTNPIVDAFPTVVNTNNEDLL